MNLNCWTFRRDQNFTRTSESWFEPEMVFKGMCEKCGPWTIPTGHPDLEITSDSILFLKQQCGKPFNVQRLDELSTRLGIRRRIYPGAALGATKVLRLSGTFGDEFLWGVMAPILRDSEFARLNRQLRGRLMSRLVENLETYDVLVELVVVGLDLDRFFPSPLCAFCQKPNTKSIAADEVRKAAEAASGGIGIYEIPRGYLLVDSEFKDSVQRVGLKNASFKPFIIDKYLSQFEQVI